MHLLTTSRKPSQRTRSFCKDLARALEIEYFNRGKANLEYLLSLAEGGALVMVSERRGNPSRIDIVEGGGRALILLLESVSLKRELRSGVKGYSHGVLGEMIERKLSQEEGKVLLKGNSVLVPGGPEFKVKKVIRRDDYFKR